MTGAVPYFNSPGSLSMDHQASSAGAQKRSSVEYIKSSEPVGRLRAACDSCHQAKVKCSGETPCSTCQASQLQCMYSPASRQGRPKGSKNKRTLLQETKGKGIETEIHDDALRTQEPSRLQLQRPKFIPAEYALNPEHEFNAASATNQYFGGDPDLLLSSDMSSFLDSASANSFLDQGLDATFAEHLSTHTRAPSIDDLNAFLARVSALSSCSFGSTTGQLLFPRFRLNLPRHHI